MQAAEKNFESNLFYLCEKNNYGEKHNCLFKKKGLKNILMLFGKILF